MNTLTVQTVSKLAMTVSGELHCRHVGGQNKKTFALVVCIKSGT